MSLQIITEPNKLLHAVAETLSIEQVKSKEINNLASELRDLMYAQDGVGIAATQVGALIKLCIIAKECVPAKERDLILINPEWKKASTLREWGEEGCLSVPEIYGLVKRYKKIRVNALNAQGQVINFIAQDLFARVIQHEADHLNGILFIEKAKKLHKAKKKQEQ